MNQLILREMKLFLVFVILINTVACSKEKEEIVEDVDEPIQSDTEIIEEEPVVTIPEVIDEDGNYIKKDDCLACVIVSNLRQRKSPEGEIITHEYDNSPIFAEPKCYKEYETIVIGDYKWIRIGEDSWIGTKPEWVVETTRDALRSPYQADERYEYIDDHGFGPDFSGDYDITKLYPMDEEKLRLSLILKKLVPCIRFDRVAEFDSRNPSEEAIDWLFIQITETSIPFSLLEEDQLVYPEIISDYLLKTGYEFYGGRASYVLQEHMDYYTNKYYGNVINFSTTPYVFFDARNYVYYYYPSTGYGEEEGYPVVLDYSVNGDVTEVVFVPIDVLFSDEENLAAIDDNDGMGFYYNEEAREYIDSLPRYKATLKLSKENIYQLITVQKMP